jgi:hypothetical protein
MGHGRLLRVGTVLVAGVGLTLTTGNWLPQAAAASSASHQAAANTSHQPAPVVGRAAFGGAVIVVLKDQHARLNLRTQASQLAAETRADQAPIVSSIRTSGGTDVTQLAAPSAVAAQVSAAEVNTLRRDRAVAEIVPNSPVRVQTRAPAPASPRNHSAAPQQPAKSQAVTCPFNPFGPSHPLQEPEADTEIHASTGIPGTPDMANSIATGKGVIVANDGMNALAGNPNFTRANGTHVVIDAPNYKKNDGNAETYEDASSVAAQGTVTYQYSGALPYSHVSPRCKFYIEGDAPGASLVDLSEIDTPILTMAQIIAGIDHVVSKVHANVISESFGVTSLPSQIGQLLADADNAAVDAGVTVVESSGDSGPSGTMIAAADDPLVIAAGDVDNFRLVATDDGYHGYVSNNLAAQSSGGTAPTGKVVNLVAPGWYGGESACAPLVGGCPVNYPTEAAAGTSEASPLIAGAAADVIQAYRDTHYGASPTPEVVRDILISTATDLNDPADQQGAGLVNVYAAVKAAQQMPGTTDTRGPGDAPGLIATPSQLDVVGDGGSASDQSVDLYNASDSATTVTGSYRQIGPAHQIGRVVTEHVSAPPHGQPRPTAGAKSANPISFTVPAGLDRLDVKMIWPDPSNANDLLFQLFNPQGALAQESYDYGVSAQHTTPNIGYAMVADPEPGRWTARFLWGGRVDDDLETAPPAPGSYRGPMSFQVSGQDFTTSPASPPVLIPAHSDVTVPLRIQMPAQPGDHPESVQFSADDGAAVSIPIARRTLIPARGGSFTTTITSSTGRDIGQISTYEINLPAGRRYLDVGFRAPDAAADNGFSFYLVNPSGQTVTTASAASSKTARLYTAHPAAGAWQIDVVLNLTESGEHFTEPVYGNLRDP